MEDIPDFDDLKVKLFQLLSTPFGVAGQIAVGVYILWGVVSSYVDATKSGMRLSAAIRNWFVRQHQRQSGELWYAVATTVIIIFMQLAWLGCTVVVGGLLSRFVASWDSDAPPLGAPGEALLPIQWDTISQAYVLICVVSLVAAYMLVKRNVNPTGLLLLCGFPGFFWGTLGLLGAVATTVGYVVGLDFGIDSFESVLSIWVLVAAGLIFLGITHVSLNGPLFIKKAWSKQESSSR